MNVRSPPSRKDIAFMIQGAPGGRLLDISTVADKVSAARTQCVKKHARGRAGYK